MKKVLLITIFSGFMLANNVTVEGMAELEAGVNKIQKGFLYNQKAMIIEGADDVAKANVFFHDIDSAKKYLPDHQL